MLLLMQKQSHKFEPFDSPISATLFQLLIHKGMSMRGFLCFNVDGNILFLPVLIPYSPTKAFITSCWTEPGSLSASCTDLQPSINFQIIVPTTIHSVNTSDSNHQWLLIAFPKNNFSLTITFSQ